jgi:hypothetical protein
MSSTRALRDLLVTGAEYDSGRKPGAGAVGDPGGMRAYDATWIKAAE